MSGLTAFYTSSPGISEHFIFTLTTPVFIFAGDNKDYVAGNSGADLLSGGADSDIVLGGGGDDTIYGDANADPSQSGGAADNVLGGSGKDTVFGGAGADFINGEHDNDWIDGGDGGDVIWGGPGRDEIFGRAGDDTLYAYAPSKAPAGLLSFNTTRDGVAAANEAMSHTATAGYIGTGDFMGGGLDGGAGDDRLVGHNGIDIFTGGKGKDEFVFNVLPGNNKDEITDFSVKDDTILLLKSKFAGIGSKGKLDADRFHVGTNAADAQDRIVYNKTSGGVSYDQDGDGVGPKLIFIKLDPGLKLTASDFLII